MTARAADLAVRTPRRVRAQIAALVVGGALILTGCAAGQRAATANEVPVIDGVIADVGPINLRNVTIVTPPDGSYAKGANADLSMYIVNNGAPDKLVSVSSSAAAAVSIYPNKDAAAASSSSPSASPSPSVSSSASASPGQSVDLPSGETTPIGAAATQPVVVITGLNAQLYPAMSIPITFTFQNAGSTTVFVSVHLAATPATNVPTEPTSHESPE